MISTICSAKVFALNILFRPRVFSLRDLQNDGNNDSSDDEKQTFYAGGEKSYNTSIF